MSWFWAIDRLLHADKVASLKIDGLKRSMQVSPTLASGSTSFSSTVLSNQLGDIDWKAHSHTTVRKRRWSVCSANSGRWSVHVHLLEVEKRLGAPDAEVWNWLWHDQATWSNSGSELPGTSGRWGSSRHPGPSPHAALEDETQKISRNLGPVHRAALEV